MKRLLVVIAVLVLLAPVPEGKAADHAAAPVVETGDVVDAQLPAVTFTDTEGRRISIDDLKGRPLLISLIYTSCVDVCPTLVQNLYPAVRVAQSALGRDSFTVLTVGFDTRSDTPDRMRSFARAQGVDLPNWRFVSTDQESLDRLAQALGFALFRRAGGFDHIAQITVVSATGKIYQQVYGAEFDPPLIVEPLKDLLLGRLRPPRSLQDFVDRIKFFCTVYDPGRGRYYFNYSLFLGVGIGLLSFGLVLTALVREWRKSSIDPKV